MISTEAWRAAIGSFNNNRCGMSFIMYGSSNLNRYHVYLVLLLLPFAVLGLVMLLSSMNLKSKRACPDCSFSTSVFMEMMFAACCYYWSRRILCVGES